MELSNSYIYKVYLKNISEKYLDDLDIIIYNDIGGVYIKCIYICVFFFDKNNSILIKYRNRRFFFTFKNIIMCVPIDTINI